MSHYGPTPDRRVARSHVSQPPSSLPRPYPPSNLINGRSTAPIPSQPSRPPRVQHVRQPAAHSDNRPQSRPQPYSTYAPSANAHSDSYRGSNHSLSFPASSYPRPQYAAYDEQLEPVFSPPATSHSVPHPTYRHRGQQRSERTSPEISRPNSPSKLKRQLSCSPPTVLLLTGAGCVLLVLLLFLGSSSSFSLNSLLASRQPTVVKHSSRSSDQAAARGGLLPLDVGEVAPSHPLLHHYGCA